MYTGVHKWHYFVEQEDSLSVYVTTSLTHNKSMSTYTVYKTAFTIHTCMLYVDTRLSM